MTQRCKCGGARWLWGHELDLPEHCGTDTRYSCDGPICALLNEAAPPIAEALFGWLP